MVSPVFASLAARLASNTHRSAARSSTIRNDRAYDAQIARARASDDRQINDTERQTPAREPIDLFAAALAGDLSRVRAALREGVSARALNDFGATPLMQAAMGGHFECVELLLPHSLADLRDGAGITALMYAASCGSARCVWLLLEKGAPDLRSAKGKTAFDFAIERGHAECANLLQAKSVPKNTARMR